MVFLHQLANWCNHNRRCCAFSPKPGASREQQIVQGTSKRTGLLWRGAPNPRCRMFVTCAAMGRYHISMEQPEDHWLILWLRRHHPNLCLYSDPTQGQSYYSRSSLPATDGLLFVYVLLFRWVIVSDHRLLPANIFPSRQRILRNQVWYRDFANVIVSRHRLSEWWCFGYSTWLFHSLHDRGHGPFYYWLWIIINIGCGHIFRQMVRISSSRGCRLRSMSPSTLLILTYLTISYLSLQCKQSFECETCLLQQHW